MREIAEAQKPSAAAGIIYGLVRRCGALDVAIAAFKCNLGVLLSDASTLIPKCDIGPVGCSSPQNPRCSRAGDLKLNRTWAPAWASRKPNLF